jgi:hypothetical protein
MSFDNDYAGVRHILTSPVLATRAAPYIGDADFDWPGLLAEAETMSGGEQVLVRIAYDLWEAEGVTGIHELPRRLDRRNFERVLEAFELCRGDRVHHRLEELRNAA